MIFETRKRKERNVANNYEKAIYLLTTEFRLKFFLMFSSIFMVDKKILISPDKKLFFPNIFQKKISNINYVINCSIISLIFLDE